MPFHLERLAFKQKGKSMMLNGEEYSKKLRSLSDDTMRLIMSFMTTQESFDMASQIISETEKEEDIVKKLKALKEEKSKT